MSPFFHGFHSAAVSTAFRVIGHSGVAPDLGLAVFVAIVWPAAPFPAVHRRGRVPGSRSRRPTGLLPRALIQSPAPARSSSLGCLRPSTSFDRLCAPSASPLIGITSLLGNRQGYSEPPAGRRAPGPLAQGFMGTLLVVFPAKASNAFCWAPRFARGGWAVASFSVRCIAHVFHSVAGNPVRCVAIQSPNAPTTPPGH